MAQREAGRIKAFIEDRGFGFIQAAGRADLFFHVSQIQTESDWQPASGDAVTFEAGTREDGSPQAIAIALAQARTEKAAQLKKAAQPEKPFYGKKTYEYRKNESYRNKFQMFLGGSFWGFVAAFFFFDESGLASIFIAMAFGFFVIFVSLFFPKQSPYIEEEITSTCLKCGGTGWVTAKSNGSVGFQCQKCKSFWRQRDA